MNLQQENKRLKEKLAHAQAWMQKEVFTKASRQDISHIEEKIYQFFSPEALIRFSENGIKNIVSSELIYAHLLSGELLDGMSVIIWYQKILDAMLELSLTKWFRKYSSQHSSLSSPENNPLEKSLYLVITKKYILSLGRLYAILQDISQKKALSPYEKLFYEYLKSRKFLYKALLESDFLLQLHRLMQIQALTEKRHSSSLSKKDTMLARKAITWNFEDRNCLLSILSSVYSTI